MTHTPTTQQLLELLGPIFCHNKASVEITIFMTPKPVRRFPQLWMFIELFTTVRKGAPLAPLASTTSAVG